MNDVPSLEMCVAEADDVWSADNVEFMLTPLGDTYITSGGLTTAWINTWHSNFRLDLPCRS